jgi:two-component system chemotaxis response regulator CheY
MIEKILIVDDSPVSRKIMKSCIPEDKGFELFEAGDGQSGIDKYQQINPELTFMDLTMPVMDGMQALQEIIKIDPKAVVIVCTADVQMKTIFKVMNLGALMVVRKPINKQAIEDALRKAEDKLKHTQ